MITATSYNCDGKVCRTFRGKTRRHVLRQLREEYEPDCFVSWLLSNLHAGKIGRVPGREGGIVFSSGRRRK